MHSNSVISVPVTISIISDDNDDIVHNCQFRFDIPDNFSYNQISNNDMVNGVSFDCTVRDFKVHYLDVSFDTNNIRIINGNAGVNYQISDDSDDDNYDFTHNLINYVFDHTNMTIDSHWNCYCRKQRVCGCDPHHDGW